MTYRLVALESICDIRSGGTPPRDRADYYGGDIPWAKIDDLNTESGVVRTTTESITEAGLKAIRGRLFEKETLLFAMYGSIGKMAWSGCRLATNQAILGISNLDHNRLNNSYLFHWLNSKQNDFNRDANGVTQKNLSAGYVRALTIPLLPLEEQKRIAAILDKADNLRRKRQEAIQLADDFLRAVFLDMFGDPGVNPKGFPQGTVRDLLDSANYGTSDKANELTGEYPVLRMNNITYDGSWDFSSLKYMDLDEKGRDKYLARSGDILFNRTNSVELVGKTAVYEEDRPMAFAGYLVRARVKSGCDPYYVAGYLNSLHGKATLRSIAKSIVGMANINAQEMQNIPILLPPNDLQHRYGQIVTAVRANQKTHRHFLEEVQVLTSTLSSRLFN
jgi:type I restriction enzyme S subunit